MWCSRISGDIGIRKQLNTIFVASVVFTLIHQRRSNPNEFGFNIACLEDVDPFAVGEVPMGDDINHLCDK